MQKNKIIREFQAMRRFYKGLIRDNGNKMAKEIWVEYMVDFKARMQEGEFIFI